MGRAQGARLPRKVGVIVALCFSSFPETALPGERGAGMSGGLGLSHSISQRPSFLTCNWVTYKWVSGSVFPGHGRLPGSSSSPASCSGGWHCLGCGRRGTSAPCSSPHQTWGILVWQRVKRFLFMSLQAPSLPASSLPASSLQPPSWPGARARAKITTQTHSPDRSSSGV